MNSGIGGVNLGINALGHESKVQSAELRQHSTFLATLVDLEKTVLDAARSQGRDVNQLVQQSRQMVNSLDAIRAHTEEQSALTREMIKHLASAAIIMRATLTTSEKIYDVLGDIHATIRSPIQTRADEEWQIGERCRLAGDAFNAVRFLEKSQNENPSDPKTYLSLANVALDFGAFDRAITFLNNGLRYVDDNPLLQMKMIRCLAEAYYRKSNFPEAKKILGCITLEYL